ncbi:MAG: amino acid permease [Cyclobacteriaceae bacterium]|nr:amino acid permease [Cyclobacteriaceae bacterium]
MTEQKTPAKIGLWTTTALVVGNMVGSGVFLLPATLAAYGGISLLGWIGSSVGAIFLALLFSKLSKIVPNAIGGPYAFTRVGLGDFAAYLVAWGYWFSIWCTNAAIAVTFTSYLTVFFPILAVNKFLAVGTGISVVWLLTWVNVQGVKEAGKVQLITTILKLTPLLLISFVGLFYIDLANFTPFNVSSDSDFGAVAATATLTLFAYLGLESATIPSGDIVNPEKTIGRATMIGTILTIAVYILATIAVMGMIPSVDLQKSNAPFSDAAAIIWGDSARYWVAIGAIISTFGALNGWILLQGQIPFAAAKDKMFPEIFGRENNRKSPVMGLVISSILITGLMLMNLSKGLTETFTFLILLTTIMVLVPYLFSAASYGVILLQNRFWKKDSISNMIIAAMAFVYSVWAVVGSGQEIVYWGFVALLCGIPFYVWMRRARS